MVPSPRQFLLLALLWGVVGWLTSAAWSYLDLNAPLPDAFYTYYAVRAPLVGALAGVLWAPVVCAGLVPGRASAVAGRALGLAVETRTRWLVRGVQGVVTGICIGPTGTILSLLIWPNDAQNSRWDAFRWGAFIWYADWWLFVPIGTVGGLLSLWVARRWRS